MLCVSRTSIIRIHNTRVGLHTVCSVSVVRRDLSNDKTFDFDKMKIKTRVYLIRTVDFRL